MNRSFRAQHTEWRLGAGSGDIVEMALRKLRLDFYQVADLPKMKANIRARRNAWSVGQENARPPDHLSSDSVCKYLMNGPGSFMIMRCCQHIHVELLTADLQPLRYLNDILQYTDTTRPAITLSSLIDSLFPPSTARSDPLIPMQGGEFKAWFGAILGEIDQAYREGRPVVTVSYSLYDLPTDSISLMVTQDLAAEERAYRKPISSMYVKDQTSITGKIDDSSQTSYMVNAAFYFPATLDALPGPDDTFQGPIAGLTIGTLPSSEFSRGLSAEEQPENLSDSTLITWYSKQQNTDGSSSVWRLGPVT